MRFLFWLYAWRLYVPFSPKNRRCYLFKEALKLLFSFLEVVRFYNINHFLCSKIFSWAFGFGSTHGGFTRDYHLKNVNLKTWIIHEQLGLGIGWIHFWDPITPRILKITLILQGTYFCYYWPFQALCVAKGLFSMVVIVVFPIPF